MQKMKKNTYIMFFLTPRIMKNLCLEAHHQQVWKVPNSIQLFLCQIS